MSWADAQVDADKGVISGIKLLSERSRNGRLYPANTRRSAHKLMEGIVVNLNHHQKKSVGADTPVESRIGKLINVREDGDGTYADLHFLTKHPMAGALIEAAQRMPEVYGMSINGKGTLRKNKAGELIVESIDTLRSVDLVADPGATKSLFESADQPEQVDPDAAMDEAFCQAVMAVVKGDGDLSAKLKKIKEILKAQEKLSDKGEDTPAEEAPGEQAPTEESWKEDYENLKLEKECRSLLESAKVAVEQPLVESLMSMNSDKARQDFVSWHKRVSVSKSPKSADPIAPAQTQKDWASLLRSK